jgi:hypothetical protein
LKHHSGCRSGDQRGNQNALLARPDIAGGIAERDARVEPTSHLEPAFPFRGDDREVLRARHVDAARETDAIMRNRPP